MLDDGYRNHKSNFIYGCSMLRVAKTYRSWSDCGEHEVLFNTRWFLNYCERSALNTTKHVKKLRALTHSPCAIASAPLLCINLSRASLTRQTHINHEPIVEYQCLHCLPGKDHWTRLSAFAEDLSFLLTWGSHIRHTGRCPKRTVARTGTENAPIKKEKVVL